MKVFIDKNKVIINESFEDMVCSDQDDNSTMRVIKLSVEQKDYYFLPCLFIGNKENFCAILYGKQTVNLFKSRTKVEILRDYNTTGLKLECNDQGVPLFFHKEN